MRDKREKGWFWLDNAIVDRTDLNVYEKMLYMCMARHTGEKDYCFPALDTLCKELGIKDTRTVVKYIKSLEEKGLVEVKKVKGKSNRYYLNNVKLPTTDVPTYNVPSLNVPTSDVTTFDVPTTPDDTTPPTSDVPTSTHIRCTPKKTNIKKTKEKDITTTKKDIVNNIDLENYETEKSSSSFFELVKNILDKSNISDRTKTNILALSKDTDLRPERVSKVLEVAKKKNWQEGAIYTALRDNWSIDDSKNQTLEEQERERQRVKSAQIDEQMKKDSQKFQEQKDKVMAEQKEKEDLLQYLKTLDADTQKRIRDFALEKAKKQFPAVYEIMANSKVLFEVIREYRARKL